MSDNSSEPQAKPRKPSSPPSILHGMSSKRKKMLAVLIAFVLFGTLFIGLQKDLLTSFGYKRISVDKTLGYLSQRADADGPDLVVASQADPFYSIIATPVAVWYDIGVPEGGEGLRPFFIVDQVATDQQMRFETYLDTKSALVLGSVDSGMTNEEIIDSEPPQASIEVAKATYQKAPGALIVRYTQDGYEMADSAAVLASYLNIPVLVLDDNSRAISDLLNKWDAKYIIAVGHDADAIGRTFGRPTVVLDCQKSIRSASLKVIEDRFGRIDYMVMSNPKDVVPPAVLQRNITKKEGHITDLSVLMAGNEVGISGTRVDHYELKLEPGIQLVKIWANITATTSYFKRVKRELGVQPIINIDIKDADGNVVSYSPSFANANRAAYTEFLLVNYTEPMDLEISMWYGTKGFSSIAWGSSGYTKVDADYELTIETSTLSTAHWPLLEGASLMAPYIAASHGGIVMAGPGFEMTDDIYPELASGATGGPWYNWEQSSISSVKALEVAEALNETVESLKAFNSPAGNGTMFDTYTGEHGWLAILGDSNMIPFYYYPIDPAWEDDPIYGVGWPGDLLYNYNGTLSMSRLVAQTTPDISTQIARTLFYQEYTEAYKIELAAEFPASNTWGDHYGLMYGEGGGQTGGLFWQDPFTVELAQNGWTVQKYGFNLKNDRQTMEETGAYSRANFFEVMLHGNWYWYVPEMNGADSYSTAVKVSDVNGWELGPMTFLTAACLMGRIDGVPPETQISMSFIHSGVNAVFSATRSTGQESSTREIERDLIYNDLSVGEALRNQKNNKPEPPTLYVRLVFGDPAFNPYEPEHGYSDQGRPVLLP